MDAPGWSLTRRAAMRMLMAGTAGLALLPARLLGDDEDTGTLAKWARVGRLWRAMGAHWRGEAGERQEAEKDFDELKAELEEALNAVEASDEFRALCLERWYHVYRSRYWLATCYLMAPVGVAAMQARGDVEKRVQELEELAAESKLSDGAVKRAAKAIAPAAEYLTLAHDAWRGEERDDEAARLLEVLADDYSEGRLNPSKAATKAAERAANMTVRR